jgi:uncharacterized protein YndB with AHSA1/START domain
MSTALQINRTLPYPIERVWRALTDPTALTGWFWPQRFEPTVEVDLRVGGRYRIAGPAVGLAVTGQYLVVEPPNRLSFTWRWDGEADESLVTVALTGADGATTLAIVHERFPDEGSRDEHAKGWNDCLDRLPTWLAAH